VVELGAILVPMVVGFAASETARGADFPAGETAAIDGLPAGETNAVEGLPTGETSAVEGLPTGEASAVEGLPTGEAGAVKGLPAGETAAIEGLPAGETAAIEGLPAGETSTGKGLPAGEVMATEGLPALTERGKRDLADLAAFFDGACERQEGERVQALTLYFVYADWKQSQGEMPMSLPQFGTLLTKRLGVAKSKIEGKNHYLSIRLSHPVQGENAGKRLLAAKRNTSSAQAEV
jgi:hypothetical protein